MTYTLTSSIETTGEYKCVAENEIGVDNSVVNVTPKVGGVAIKLDEKFPSYSDAILFEWSTLSGSPISQLNVQVNLISFKKLKLNFNKFFNFISTPMIIT